MTMLQGAPWLLAHRSILKPNQPFKVSLYGQDYVLWQDKTGKISCLPNACPHLGAMLSEGWCMTQADGSSTMVCPFHALEFDSHGCTVLPNSNKQTKPLLQPLDLIIQGDFIWTYGGYEPKITIPTILKDFATEYEFIGHTKNFSVKTELLTMLLNMHDYDHQNGTHRPLFEIEKVDFKEFIDHGYHSHAYFDLIRKQPKLNDIFKNLGLLAIPKTINAHLENFFPCFIVVHGESPVASAKQIHFFVPESETYTRTYVLIYGKAKHPLANLIKKNFVRLAEIIIEQDIDILGKLYPNVPQHIRLNNEIGMDWVKRVFESRCSRKYALSRVWK
ncbi:Rieske 2Fe-2S domain-containing protein [Anabaena sp. PCC 7938]|uniref:Rieske 2Fe-2S domain-containing protein n=1 Tax=Anabaena sp. PCC 7938 TaxID=1296340 RepID=UPI0020336437|nr:Rieske 2Fe-2S domain-containing protein [Anabaena sp. CCAP 1446/1C]MCM2405582.1 Rieske 2Fe-2S domain-containing protein [Anabaena sp. CCAP 1446/1C]